MKKAAIICCVLLIAVCAAAQEREVKPGVFVGEVSYPTVTPAVRDLPQTKDEGELFQVEAKSRDSHGFIGPDIQMPPHGNPLADLQAAELAIPLEGKAARALSGTIVNVEGLDHNVAPPDPTGDVGPTYVLQGVNASTSRVGVYNKSGGQVTTFYMEDLGSTSPCNSGYCDPIIQYDNLAGRWMISEFDSSANNLCVYVSVTGDPTGSWYQYDWNPSGGMQDYPKYGVWHDGYYVGVNNGGYVHALERAQMLLGGGASYQSFNIGTLSGWGFQLTMPATIEGPNAPPANEPAIFMRARDTEIHGGTCSGCDLMEMWELSVDWNTPSNSNLSQISSVQMTDWDHTVCGTSAWDCMPQSGTSQKLDPIREPLHFPLQYRNWGSYETLVGCFVEDVDGTDQAALHWFEIRRDTGGWYLYQEGVFPNDSYHRSVGSIAMDGSGNIAIGYTRTSSSSYASSYYAGRRSFDTLGTLPYFDYLIRDGSGYQSGHERWGDYAGIGIDPSDDCTFWFFGMYEEGNNNSATRIASFSFDECGGSCDPPTGLSNNTATDLNGACNDDGVRITWSQDPSDWGDGGSGTRTYDVLRGGSAIQSGLSYGTTSYTDTTGTNGTSYNYQVRYNNGCGSNEVTTGVSEADDYDPATPTISGGTSNTCPATTVALSTQTGQSNYQWYRNGSPVGTNSPNYTATTSGNYTVEYTNGSGCSGTSGVHTVTIVACEPNVVYDSVSGLTELCGDGDGIVEPGEEWRVTVQLLNDGGAQATSVTATFAVDGAGAAGTIVSTNPASYGTMAMGATATEDLDFCIDNAVVCVDDIVFDITNIDWSGGGSPPNTEDDAFSFQVGAAAGGETLDQVTDPIQASGGTATSDFDAATLGAVTSATVTYSTQCSGSGSPTIDDDDFSSGIGDWTTTGNVGASTTDGCSCPDGAGNNMRFRGSGTATAEQSFDISGYTGVVIECDYFSDNNLESGEELTAEYQVDGGGWDNWFTTPDGGDETWHCDQSQVVPNGTTLEVRFTHNSGGLNEDTRIDNFTVTGTPGGGCDWTDDVQVGFWDLSSWQIIKAYGVADSGSHDVTAYYNGPGTYRIGIQESTGGGTASLSSGVLDLSSTTECDITTTCVDCGGVVCTTPTGLNAPATSDPSGDCAAGGVRVDWDQDPGDWGDSGVGTRTYDVLRDGGDLQTGIAYGTTTWLDATAAAGTSYDYSVRYNNGCGDDATTGTTAGVDVDDSVGSMSAPGFSDDDACAQSGVTITFGTATGATAYDIWVDGTTVISGVTSPYSYDPGDTAGHDYQVRGRNASCTGSWSAVTSGADADDGVGAMSAPGFSDDDACAQDGVTITFGTATGATAYDIWVDGTIVISGVTSPYSYDPGDTAGHDYQVRGRNASCTGAWSTTTSGADADDTPTPTISGDNANTCPATTVDLSTQAGMSNYQWYIGGSPIGGANSDSYTAGATGTYTVYYENGSGCGAASAGHAVTISGCTGSPPPAPDGSAASTPLTGIRMTITGDQIEVHWDAHTCPADDYNLIWGNLADVASYTLQGAECAIGLSETHAWNGVAAEDLYFLIVGVDMSGTVESSWGTDYVGGGNNERNGSVHSGTCSITSKDTSQTCP